MFSRSNKMFEFLLSIRGSFLAVRFGRMPGRCAATSESGIDLYSILFTDSFVEGRLRCGPRDFPCFNSVFSGKFRAFSQKMDM